MLPKVLAWLPLSCLALSGGLEAQIQVSSSSEGQLSVVFTSLKEFDVTVAGTPREILIVMEDAYLTAQDSVRDDDISGFALPFLDIDEFDVDTWGLEVGAGTAAPGTPNEIDPRDLVVRFTLAAPAPISDDLTVAFGLGGVLSSSAFPAPDNLGGSTPVFFAGTNSPFTTTTLATDVSFSLSDSDAANVRLEKVEGNLVYLTLIGSAADRVLTYSEDLVEWNATDLYIPADKEFSFPVSSDYEAKRFYQLSAPRAEYPLTVESPSVSGLHLLGSGGDVEYDYLFAADGTGEQYSDSGTLNWSFNWSEVSSPGLTTVTLTFPDNYQEVINLQAPLLPPADIAFYGYRTIDQGPEGFSSSSPFDYSLSDLSLPTLSETAPATLAGLSWAMSQESFPSLAVNFLSETTATGPAILDGSDSTWDYLYMTTGKNTGTLEITDANGDFLRLFLTFVDGFLPDAFAASTVHPEAFGRSSSFFTLPTP